MQKNSSSLLRAVLLEARRLGKRFHVVVADGRPRCEGREKARALTAFSASLVDAVITEISVIPTTSVPVVLRLNNLEAASAH